MQCDRAGYGAPKGAPGQFQDGRWLQFHWSILLRMVCQGLPHLLYLLRLHCAGAADTQASVF